MQRVVDYFRGTCRICISGPWPERALNRLVQDGVRFWDVQMDEAGIFLTIYRTARTRVSESCEREGCLAQVSGVSGVRHTFRGLRRRWFLLGGMLLVTALVLFLQSFVWYFDVEGNVSLSDEEILQALESIGIGVGVRAEMIDGQYIKNHMLELLPELEWISVNKRGAHASVLVRERTQAPEVIDPQLVTNVVAAKSGVITSMEVYSGFAVTEKGKAVLQGELLVSGLGTGWGAVVCRNAQAEVYADTRYETTLVLPESYTQGKATGEEQTSWSLVIGKKRWNFSQNSGISLTGYDKIECVYSWSLPGGITFPVSLIKTTCSSYDAVTAQLGEDEAFALLSEAESAYVRNQLIAGTVLSSDAELSTENGVYQYHAVTNANEMIARVVTSNPMEQ